MKEVTSEKLLDNCIIAMKAVSVTNPDLVIFKKLINDYESKQK